MRLGKRVDSMLSKIEVTLEKLEGAFIPIDFTDLSRRLPRL